MKKHIYDVFADRWYRNNGSVFILSDPHFSDPEMKYLRKNYIGDEEQVKRINGKVGKNDTIIFLGDIGNTEYIKKIRGYKVLIMGNHDSGYSNYIRVRELGCGRAGIVENTPINCRPFLNHMIYDNHLFDEVYEGPLVISEKVILSHEPIDLPYFVSVHGHTHGLPHKYDDKHINCVAEAINYTPISLKDILESGVLKNVDSIHRLTIDTATERKKKRNNKGVHSEKN